MADRKTERLMNLIFLLIATTQYLTKAQIRSAIADYREAKSDQAFDRMFERDKEELRELGISIEVGSHDAFFDDNEGYRIPRDAAEMDDIELSREEAAVVGLAAQVWQHAGLASGSGNALLKLKSAGIDIDTSIIRMAEPRLSTNEPAFDPVWDAATQHIPIAFDYARPGQAAGTRRVQPWGMLSWRDRWYVVGFDVDRDAPRVFRVSRIQGDVKFTGKSGDYEVPEGTDLRALASTLFPAPRTEPAVLRVRTGRCQTLRRAATSVEPLDDDADQIRVPYGSMWDLAAEIASYGPDAVVISPPDLRDNVIDRLKRVATGRLSPLGGDDE